MTTTTNVGIGDPGSTAPPPVGDARASRLDAAVAQLHRGEQTWAGMGLAARRALLERVHACVAASATEWVSAAAAAKGLDADSPLLGEEWLSGPYAVLSSLSLLRASLAAVARGESPIAKRQLRRAPGGRVRVRVLPSNAYEALLLHGFRADVWMRPGLSASDVRSAAGLGAKTPTDTGGVGVVLGAGNVTSIAPLDVLYELVAHNRVSVLKVNPTLDLLVGPLTAAFAPLVELGLLRIVTGGADVGAYLAHHRAVSHVHVTGSVATHDAVVWGTGPEAIRRKAAGTPLLTREITSELGGVSPVVVLPGRWSKADLRYQAEHIATMRLHNGGYNCIAAQVVLLSEDWPQKDAFLDQLRVALNQATERAPWYPGSDARLSQAATTYPHAERLANGTRLLVRIPAGTDLSASESLSSASQTEYFAPVLAVVELPGEGQAFLDAAVTTVNSSLAGTLGANVLGTPSTIRSLGAGFEQALARLQYGTIAVNAWTGVGFLTAGAPWGAFPGHTLQRVSSGIGVVHNAYLLAGTERTVVHGPFRPFPRSVAHGELALFPKPAWFLGARTGARTGKLLTGFAAAPSWRKVPAVLASAFRA